MQPTQECQSVSFTLTSALAISSRIILVRWKRKDDAFGRGGGAFPAGATQSQFPLCKSNTMEKSKQTKSVSDFWMQICPPPTLTIICHFGSCRQKLVPGFITGRMELIVESMASEDGSKMISKSKLEFGESDRERETSD